MNLSRNQGIVLALGAAIVSGISIYVNKFGVAQVSDPFIYTTVKNSVVVVGLLAAVGLLASWKQLRGLTPAQWLAWIVITAAFLLGYVWIWYNALKPAPATLVTSVLTIGAIVTILLTAVLNGQLATTPQLVAMLLLVVGAAVFALPSRLWWRRAPEVALCVYTEPAGVLRR